MTDSYKMDNDEQIDNADLLQNCLETFIYHVKELGDEDDPTGDGFTREFKVIRDIGLKMREENTHPAEEGRKPCNIKKNRYKDILPFDSTRVILDEIPGEDGSDYINANFIQDLNGYNSYIASQGPVPLTVYDFHRMILQYKVKVVAMACRTVEMGKKKCEEYWPPELNETVEFRDISVTLVDIVEIAEHCTRRELCISKPGCDSHTVTQFHYTGWPDHDIPKDFDDILEMMAEMREIKQKDVDKAPMVIHCSAGCGRTGTICAIDYSWDLLKSGNLKENFSLYEIVLGMREQRQSMIQAPEQYKMAHITVQTLFQKHLDMMEDHTYGNVQFNIPDEDVQHGGDAASETSSLGVAHQDKRKDSCLSHEIANTIAMATHHTTQDELATPLDETVPVNLQKPLIPVSAVYEAEPLSPTVKDLRDKFADDKSSKVFPVVQIDNIPVEKRYLDNVTKEDVLDRKLSYMPSDSRKKDLEAKKKIFENDKKPAPEPPKTNDVKSSIETHNSRQDWPTQKPGPDNKPQLQRVYSTQTDNKHVTVLTVGGGNLSKSVVKQTVSVPGGNVSIPIIRDNRPKTLPSGKVDYSHSDAPQSSVPPSMPPTQQTDSLYSYAGNSAFSTSLANDNSGVNSRSLVNKTTNGSAADAYSELSSYHSGSLSGVASDPYSYIDEGRSNLGDQMIGSNVNSSQVYSYATEHVDADNLYSSVNKNGKSSRNHHSNDGTYETVTIGNSLGRDKAPPPVPSRGYMEDDSTDKSGDANTLSRKAQFTSAFKNLFTSKGGQNSTSDVPTDIPGFMVKIGGIPRGPRDPPVSWKKK